MPVPVTLAQLRSLGVGSVPKDLAKAMVGTPKWVHRGQNGCISPVSENRLKISNFLNKRNVFIEKRDK